jgi:hypothetical protein
VVGYRRVRGVVGYRRMRGRVCRVWDADLVSWLHGPAEWRDKLSDSLTTRQVLPGGEIIPFCYNTTIRPFRRPAWSRRIIIGQDHCQISRVYLRLVHQGTEYSAKTGAYDLYVQCDVPLTSFREGCLCRIPKVGMDAWRASDRISCTTRFAASVT